MTARDDTLRRANRKVFTGIIGFGVFLVGLIFLCICASNPGQSFDWNGRIAVGLIVVGLICMGWGFSGFSD